MTRTFRRGAAPALFVALALAGCDDPRNSRWEAKQKESQGKPAVSKEAVPGSEFNKFFPKYNNDEGWDFVYKQEKAGVAIGELKKGGKPVAGLSISDTISTPETADKYKDADRWAGFPFMAEGKNGSMLLVANRFQVKVRSLDDSFTEEMRKEWLGKFDLQGLAQLN